MNKMSRLLRRFSSACLNPVLLLLLFHSPGFALTPIEVSGVENGTRLDTYEIWHDTEGKQSLTDALQAAKEGKFKPSSSNGSTGLQPGAFWSHFYLRNTSDQDITLHLEYVDHQLIYLNAYQRNHSAEPFTQIADLALNQPFSHRKVPHHRFVVPVKIGAGETAELFYRFGSDGKGFVFPSLRIWAPENLQYTQNVEVWMIAFFMGGLVLMAVLALVGWFSIGDKFFFAYFLYALAKITVWPTILGFTHQFVITNSFHWSYMSITGAVTLFAGVFFARIFLQTRKYIRWIDYILIAMLINAGMLVVFGILRETTWSVISITFALLMTPVMVVVGVVRAIQGSKEAAIFAVAWAFLTLGLFTQALRDLGLVEHNFVNYYWPAVASYSEMMVILVAMGMRLKSLRQKKEEAERRYTEHLEQITTKLENLVAERTKDLERAKSHAEHEASTDALTGINNRRSFLLQAQALFERSQNRGEAFNLLMFDIDHFKNVNDTYGHGVGDKTLVAFAKALREGLRDIDIMGRLGGEEFAVAMNGSKQSTVHTAERLRQAISDLSIDTDNGELHISTSIGVAQLNGETTLDQLMVQADNALYQAKENGRNQVVFAHPIS